MTEYPERMHTVNAALTHLMREARTWAQITDVADAVLSVSRVANSMRREHYASQQEAASGALNKCERR